jgi:GH15 family glucan-1,4-alpha-glucosidase
VHHSGRVLQALTFEPTGAIVAAPTTSLPETVGGERNWDYRYTWIRDASLTMGALWVAACPDEASNFFTFLAAASQLQDGADLQIMFGIGGEQDLSERELPHLAGWRDSRPVRVGNDAWRQRQLDVYGECSAPPSYWSTSSASSTPSPSSSSQPPPTPLPAGVGKRTRASGKSAAGPATFSTPS